MERITSAIERVRTIPGARVDVGLYQGTRLFLAHLAERFGEQPDDLSETNQDVVAFNQCLGELKAFVSPLHLPDDFLFFLKFYGGLGIDSPRYHFAIEGIGPMAEEWYGYILGDDQFHENGFLNIGILSLPKKGHFVSFYLDLAGVVGKHCVLSIPECGMVTVDIPAILQAPYEHPKQWTKLADSFTEWLELVAKTEGTLEYV